ncbi:hypothetical protein ACJJTC_006750 [Scirpophaga incertulas]
MNPTKTDQSEVSFMDPSLRNSPRAVAFHQKKILWVSTKSLSSTTVAATRAACYTFVIVEWALALRKFVPRACAARAPGSASSGRTLTSVAARTDGVMAALAHAHGPQRAHARHGRLVARAAAAHSPQSRRARMESWQRWHTRTGRRARMRGTGACAGTRARAAARACAARAPGSASSGRTLTSVAARTDGVVAALAHAHGPQRAHARHGRLVARAAAAHSPQSRRARMESWQRWHTRTGRSARMRGTGACRGAHGWSRGSAGTRARAAARACAARAPGSASSGRTLTSVAARTDGVVAALAHAHGPQGAHARHGRLVARAAAAHSPQSRRARMESWQRWHTRTGRSARMRGTGACRGAHGWSRGSAGTRARAAARACAARAPGSASSGRTLTSVAARTDGVVAALAHAHGPQGAHARHGRLVARAAAAHSPQSRRARMESWQRWHTRTGRSARMRGTGACRGAHGWSRGSAGTRARAAARACAARAPGSASSGRTLTSVAARTDGVVAALAHAHGPQGAHARHGRLVARAAAAHSPQSRRARMESWQRWHTRTGRRARMRGTGACRGAHGWSRGSAGTRARAAARACAARAPGSASSGRTLTSVAARTDGVVAALAHAHGPQGAHARHGRLVARAAAAHSPQSRRARMESWQRWHTRTGRRARMRGTGAW